jgi:hypothetical protein
MAAKPVDVTIRPINRILVALSAVLGAACSLVSRIGSSLTRGLPARRISRIARADGNIKRISKGGTTKYQL